MNLSSRLLQPDDVKIEEIIDSFTRFALRDIKVNIPNPIAAFILISCFIDQMAAYAYNTQIGQAGPNYRRFIVEYFQNYDPLKLWENLRCALVHNYTISPNFALSSEPHPDLPPTTNISANDFTVTGFIKELETALADLSAHLRSKPSQIRQNALNKFNDSPIIIGVNRSSWQYDEPEADYLVKYYEPIILGRPLNGHNDLPITSIVRDPVGSIFLIKCIAAKGNRDYEAKLDIVTQQLQIIYPIDVLKQAGFLV
jgi:hypothetical protein